MEHHFSFFVNTLILLILFLIGASSLTAFNSALLKFGKFQVKELLNIKYSKFFLGRLFLKYKWEKFYFLVSITKHILYILYAITAFLFIMLILPSLESIHNNLLIVLIIIMILLFFMIVDFIMRLIAMFYTRSALVGFAPICSIYMLILFPLTAPLLFLIRLFYKKVKTHEYSKRCLMIKEKVLEMIKDSELSTILSVHDQKIIASFITFREKVAREIMIPRVDIFSLSKETTIKEASKVMLSEDYSRVPVYSENMDNIVGVLMYKDILKIYTKLETAQNKTEILNTPIGKIIKPVLYAPENKKIAQLFQEFRNKHIHLAIIVNEYGGTEGIVTIEDILEELVGEIKDEYDINEDKQFWQLPSGSWIVDAKMSIIDIEEKLGIKIPSSPEYETIGGYVFHRAGTIPSKGWSIHHDNFEIEVLLSNERYIEKIRITALPPKS